MNVNTKGVFLLFVETSERFWDVCDTRPPIGHHIYKLGVSHDLPGQLTEGFPGTELVYAVAVNSDLVGETERAVEAIVAKSAAKPFNSRTWGRLFSVDPLAADALVADLRATVRGYAAKSTVFRELVTTNIRLEMELMALKTRLNVSVDGLMEGLNPVCEALVGERMDERMSKALLGGAAGRGVVDEAATAASRDVIDEAATGEAAVDTPPDARDEKIVELTDTLIQAKDDMIISLENDVRVWRESYEKLAVKLEATNRQLMETTLLVPHKYKKKGGLFSSMPAF